MMRRYAKAATMRAARQVVEDIDTPQACSHAELRATAREFRAALAAIGKEATDHAD